MKLRMLSVLLAIAMGPSGVWAETAGPLVAPHAKMSQIASLTDVLKIGSVIEVMREEGIAHGAEMADEMFPGQGGSGWQSMVEVIYDSATLRQRFEVRFREALQGSSEVQAIVAFFGSDLGQRVLMLEIEARRALLEEDAEEAAKLAYGELESKGGPRMAALQAFVDINDLIESNVMGALNANLAFYQGMAEVGGFTEAMPEDQMLAEIWAQEPDMRAETVDWLYPYLSLAYKPLSDAELQTYQDFSGSPAGQAINAALFAAFDALFVGVSRDLGRAAATQMQGREL
jgi:hypothetical protein